MPLPMYLPPHFAEPRPEELHQLMRNHPLGMLVTVGPDGADADHLPFELEAAAGTLGRLRAHVARANTLWQRCPSGTPVLVVFRGAEAYISPNWYPSKHETHRQVPTWNYEVVHVRGILTVRDDERYLRGVVGRLTRTHEATESRPWKMGEAPPDYIDGLLKAIVGIEIEITALEGKRKLSQNKQAHDRLNAADRLDVRGHAELAQSMRQVG